MAHDCVSSRLKYYRACLADAERMEIDDKKIAESASFVDDLTVLPDQVLRKFFPHAEKEQKHFLDVFVAPLRLLPEVKDNHLSGAHRIYPYWIPARIDSDGGIHPPSNEKSLPWLVRGVLEPNTAASGEYPALCTIDRSDKTASSADIRRDSWDLYWADCRVYFEKLCGADSKALSFDGWIVDTSSIAIMSAWSKGLSARLIELYDSLDGLEVGAIPPFLSRVTFPEGAPAVGVPDALSVVFSSRHIGQMGKKFPLSPSQRITMALHGKSSHGDVLAVNGPPGTGKTTLLQSVCADEIVHTVLAEKRPPIMIACSTNNKAIMNILGSFKSISPEESERDGLNERWLPEFESVGLYLVSNSVPERIQEALDQGYPVLSASGPQGQGVDSYADYVERHPLQVCEAYFRAKFKARFADASVGSLSAALTLLYQELRQRVTEIEGTLAAANGLISVSVEFGVDRRTPALLLSKIEERRKKLADLIAALNRVIVAERLEREVPSAIRRAIGKIKGDEKPSVRCARVMALLLDCGCAVEGVDVLDLYSLSAAVFAKADKAVSDERVLSDLDASVRRMLSVLAPYFSFDSTENDWMEEVQAILDRTLRHDAFWLALHYLEGKWLEQRDDVQFFKLKKSEKDVRAAYAQMSFLTPLFVTTFHSAANFFSYSKPLPSGQWLRPPALEIADLLLVDEAGQTAPDIGVPVFCFARRALVVGDVKQIEPVWSLQSESIDRSNAEKYGLCKNAEDYSALQDRQIGCRNGSLMRLAQLASRFRYPEESDVDGSLLTEHRRCVGEIIEFCNRFVYNGLLQVKSGSIDSVRAQRPETDSPLKGLPALGYCHIAGTSEKRNGSQTNKAEADAIALWIAENKKSLSALYPKEKKLADILAIVTPFSAQRKVLLESLDMNGIDCTGLTIGTVHALQGAERPIVIFSPVYGRNAKSEGLFFDRTFNMINVAVSRAKHHFLVFGCVSHFNRPNSRGPAGSLGVLLFGAPENEISNAFFFNKPESTPLKELDVGRLNTLGQHRSALRKALQMAQRRLIVVSPFISAAALEADDIPGLIASARKREVEVLVITDAKLDMVDGQLKTHAKLGRSILEECGAHLILKEGIHSKTLVIDEDIFIEGSFNWFSAVRDPNSPFARFEASIVVKQPGSKAMIQQVLEDLALAPKEHAPAS